MSALIGVVLSRIRPEDKLLIQELERRGLPWQRIDDNEIHWNLSDTERPWDVVLDRSISFGRSLATLRILESRGIRCINPSSVVATCGDKAATQAVLEQAGIPSPRARVAFTQASALAAAEDLGYPVVLKPTIGSWGRLVAKLRDRDAAEAVFEDRAVLGDWTQHIFYLQEFVEKPGRDIRMFVFGGEPECAIYRHSEHWITNTARGGSVENCPLDDELIDLGRRVAATINGAILAVDVVESADGRKLVLEVNHNMEFRNSIAPTGVDIPARIIDVAVRELENTRC